MSNFNEEPFILTGSIKILFRYWKLFTIKKKRLFQL
jgi:hypothetical protein